MTSLHLKNLKVLLCYFQSIIGVLLEWTALVLWYGVSLTLILIITKIIDIFSDFALELTVKSCRVVKIIVLI